MMAAMTLTDFLLARIAEDEAVARSAVAPAPVPAYYRTPEPAWQAWAGWDGDRGADLHHVCVDPSRMLAECEAKRARIDHYRRISRRSDGGRLVHEEYLMAEGAVRKQLMFDAAVYADHPDYDEGWRP